jgi:hypothetical protein
MQKSKNIYLISGGFGNRLIIYSYLKKIKKKSNDKISIIFHRSCKVDYNEPNKFFNLQVPVNDNSDLIIYYFKPLFRRLKLESIFNGFLKRNNIIFHFNYFQDKKYFSDELTKLDSYFKLDIKPNYNLNSIFIHVRRGDYYTKKFVSRYGNICTVKYFEKAVSKMKNEYELNDSKIIIISDDIEWCKENLDFKNIIFHKSKSLIDDWMILKKSKYLIISNSTFSLTAAWAGNVKHVCYPNMWDNFDNNKDLFKKEWIKI